MIIKPQCQLAMLGKQHGSPKFFFVIADLLDIVVENIDRISGVVLGQSHANIMTYIIIYARVPPPGKIRILQTKTSYAYSDRKMKIPRKHLQELYQLLASVKSPKDAKVLLEDLLTPQELGTLAERWQLVRLLNSGMTQRAISKALKVSISKVTRGSRVLQYGRGGFKKFLKK